MDDPSFWTDNPKADATAKTLSRLKRQVETQDGLAAASEEIAFYFSYLKENEDDGSLGKELLEKLGKFSAEIDELELLMLLNQPMDTHNAILSIIAGAGGTDAQDWAELLLRMYLRWAEAQGFKTEILQISSGDEAGIKSATVQISGDFAYGLVKTEKGIHRLVRISPFNANGKRQTSFAAIDVMPELPDLTAADLNIKPDDLKIDTFRASGAGGQHVNKTDSAVRITHLPSKTVAQCQAGRSQAANKEQAMALLVARLMQRMEAEHKATLNDLKGPVADIAWGNQIRSYVFHPYQMVKDHRSNHEVSQVQDVMDGKLQDFIDAELRRLASNS